MNGTTEVAEILKGLTSLKNLKKGRDPAPLVLVFDWLTDEEVDEAFCKVVACDPELACRLADRFPIPRSVVVGCLTRRGCHLQTRRIIRAFGITPDEARHIVGNPSVDPWVRSAISDELGAADEAGPTARQRWALAVVVVGVVAVLLFICTSRQPQQCRRCKTRQRYYTALTGHTGNVGNVG